MGCLDYNFIMYGIDQEESHKYGSSTYFLPKCNKKLIFAGFGGIIKEIERAKKNNDLSIGLFDNLREGNWLLDYYIDRLKRFKHLGEFTDIITRIFNSLR